jgi:tRNA G18 (ribose-2'-O)-methylase SpoU
MGVSVPAKLARRGLFIAEGRFVVRRLLEQRRFVVRSVLVNQAGLASLGDAIERCAAAIDVFVAPTDQFLTATGFNIHRGCLAIAERPEPAPMASILTGSRLVALLERVADADNVGSVFRCAEAFGVDAILLSPGCSDPLYRKAIRTSSGAALVVPFAVAEPWPDSLDSLRGRGFVIAATTPAHDAMDIGAFVQTPMAREPIAVLLGTEGQGLTADALARADVRLRIPMTGALDSLNIATAAGIVLHRLNEVR